MRATHVFVNLAVGDIDAAREFYADYLGFAHEGFNLGWAARFSTPDQRAHVQLVTGDATSPVDSVASISVDDIGAAYAQAIERDYDIVHPLAEEAWGIRRFLVRDPDGNVLNINNHRDAEHGS